MLTSMTGRMPVRVVDTLLVGLNRFIFRPARHDRSCDQLLKYWPGDCAPMVAEIDWLSYFSIAHGRRLGSKHHDRSADQSLK